MRKDMSQLWKAKGYKYKLNWVARGKPYTKLFKDKDSAIKGKRFIKYARLKKL